MRSGAFTEWETPQDFYDALDREFCFTMDVCAIEENAKHHIYLSPKDDALSCSWGAVCWMNPPYDGQIGLWLEKAFRESQSGKTVVCLIQGRSTDTKWWHEYVMKASEIRFIKNRLHFGKNGIFKRANISSAVVVFLPFCQGPPRISAINIQGDQISPKRNDNENQNLPPLPRPNSYGNSKA